MPTEASGKPTEEHAASFVLSKKMAQFFSCEIQTSIEVNMSYYKLGRIKIYIAFRKQNRENVYVHLCL